MGPLMRPVRPMRRIRFSPLVVVLVVLLGLGGAGAAAAGVEEPVDVRVDDVFFDTFIRDALANISIQTGVPIVADTTVTGFVTLELVDVPLRRALSEFRDNVLMGRPALLGAATRIATRLKVTGTAGREA